MDARQRYEVTAMVIPSQQHPPTNEQAALDYAGENFHRVAHIMLNRPWPEAQQAIADIFAAGMRHIMSLPLADRLTAEEREGFRSCHRLRQSKEDSEATVIQGWVARDECGFLAVYKRKPERELNPYVNQPSVWNGEVITTLNEDSFLDLTWESDPETVEITIKRKKK